MKNKVNLSMDVLTAIKDRRSIRGFLKRDVSKQLIADILEIARWAPSGVNTQPWQVAVLGSKKRREIATQIVAAREKNIAENPDYHYYPTEWFDPYKSRRKACGAALYGALNIDIKDTERRKIQWYKNYEFFNAPCAMIVYMDKRLCTGSWMDVGMFIQNIMLAARGMGLETCPQASLAEYPDIIRNILNIDTQFAIVCGISIGYADWSLPENLYRTEREPVESFTQWHP